MINAGVTAAQESLAAAERNIQIIIVEGDIAGINIGYRCVIPDLVQIKDNIAADCSVDQLLNHGTSRGFQLAVCQIRQHVLSHLVHFYIADNGIASGKSLYPDRSAAGNLRCSEK